MYGNAEINYSRQQLSVLFSGEVGASMADVRQSVDCVLGEGSFDTLRELGIERGSPDFQYFLTVPGEAVVAAGVTPA